MATVQQAEQQALQAGADPATLSFAKSQLGSTAYKGYCERFVENAQGVGGQYPSAIAAWNAQQNQATQGISGAQPGDVVYFSANPSNENYGHTGIYAGNNQFYNPTYNGVKLSNITDWLRATGQQILGYIDKTAGGFANKVKNTAYELANNLVPKAYAEEEEKKKTNYSAPINNYIPSSFTGYVGTTPYLQGQIQTSGGGFYTDPNTGKVSYSAGYHGGGGGWFEDRGQWGTGMNMGPMVNGTVQTGGGGFTPDGSYSAGYHGSGEHPEITGESTPGIYTSKPIVLNGVLRQGSFGPIAKPDLSNGGKVKDFIDYVSEMGYDTSQVDRAAIERQYNQQGGNFDGVAFLETLPQKNAQKTELIKQYASNPMMPTSQMYNLLGGQNYSNLFTDVNSLKDIGNAVGTQMSLA
jgi:hypothetical protein